ncbi:MAG TPA: magnesium chelatase subunit D [Beijerinckiaceae bacterium]|jgi:magnesium chelatase subunit D
MTGDAPTGDAPAWRDASLAAALFAVDPAGLGGIALRARPGPVRERWLADLGRLLGFGLRKIPPNVPDGRLLGGLDLAATLATGRPVAERGLLAEADGGCLLLAMAERVQPGTAAILAAALDQAEVASERDGFGSRARARFGLVALDEGVEDERLPAALLDRLAFAPDLAEVSLRDGDGEGVATPAQIMEARACLDRGVGVPPDTVAALCAAAHALGVTSLRAPLLALRAARAAAALAGRDDATPDDVALAARLVLAPRATQLPSPAETDAADESEGQQETSSEAQSGQNEERDGTLEDRVLAATSAAIPQNLLASLQLQRDGRARTRGRAGASQVGGLKGRPAGARRGDPRAGRRLALVETLRAAAPWQRLRREAQPADAPRRIEVRRDDLRVTRFVQRARTCTIFAVDASGSAALQRLAEAKGAVERLLAESYVRRDQVALVAFRGRGAEILLPPTRSLVRAKRSLAALPGGGGTPLAAGLDAAALVAEAARRRGETPVIVVLTDGRANVARDGIADRARADGEALSSAKLLRARGTACLLIDIAPRPRREGAALAAALGARYLPLPQADAALLSRAVGEARDRTLRAS